MPVRTLKEIMTRDVVTVTKLDNIYEIAVKMRDNDIGFVPVVEGKKCIGVVTDRDLVIRGYAQKHSGSTAVEQVMTPDCVKAAPDTTVEQALRIMAERQIRRLVIEENGQLAGVVAIGDMAVRGEFDQRAGQALSEISEHEQFVGAGK